MAPVGMDSTCICAVVAQLHDGAFAELPLDLCDGGLNSLFTICHGLIAPSSLANAKSTPIYSGLLRSAWECSAAAETAAKYDHLFYSHLLMIPDSGRFVNWPRLLPCSTQRRKDAKMQRIGWGCRAFMAHSLYRRRREKSGKTGFSGEDICHGQAPARHHRLGVQRIVQGEGPHFAGGAMNGDCSGADRPPRREGCPQPANRPPFRPLRYRGHQGK